jgi:hypothetical protein
VGTRADLEEVTADLWKTVKVDGIEKEHRQDAGSGTLYSRAAMLIPESRGSIAVPGRVSDHGTGPPPRYFPYHFT